MEGRNVGVAYGGAFPAGHNIRVAGQRGGDPLGKFFSGGNLIFKGDSRFFHVRGINGKQGICIFGNSHSKSERCIYHMYPFRDKSPQSVIYLLLSVPPTKADVHPFSRPLNDYAKIRSVRHQQTEELIIS